MRSWSHDYLLAALTKASAPSVTPQQLSTGYSVHSLQIEWHEAEVVNHNGAWEWERRGWKVADNG